MSTTNLLDEPCFSVVRDGGDAVSLPDLMADLYLDDVDALPGIRPHQEGAALAFLTALAAHCLDTPAARPGSSTWWRERLLALTGGSEAAWSLVVDDAAMSAFMQPGTPSEARTIAPKDPIHNPDGLDVLVTSKSWDQKATVMTQPSLEHWVWALVSLQTTSPFLGRGNYGIIRMNGGFSSRSMTGRSRSLRWGPRMRSDAELMLARQAEVAETHGLDLHGIRLLWQHPWSGEEPLDPGALHPWCIEVCRRVRLARADDSSLVAYTQSTKGPRVEARSRNGDLGDPWLPTHRSEPKAFSLGSRGFTYDVMRQVVAGGGDLKAPLAVEDGQGSIVWATGVAGGKGKTAGAHQRALTVPQSFIKQMFDAEEAPRVAEAGEQMVAKAALCRAKVLYPALLTLMNHDRDSARRGDARPGRFMEQFERAVDDAYFPHLFTWSPDVDEPTWLDTWARELFDIAARVFRDAVQMTTGSSQRGWAAIVGGERVLYGAARNHLDLDWSDDDVDAA